MARVPISKPQPIEPQYLAIRPGAVATAKGIHTISANRGDTSLGEILREHTPVPPPDADIEAVLRDAVLRERARIERRVHEAMLTISSDPTRIGPADPHGAWPHYPAESQDYVGDLRDPSDTPRRKWRPTPAQIDDSLRVLQWFSRFWNHDLQRRGLDLWQRSLLEMRGWQTIFGKPSWRAIETAMADQPRMPTRSHTWWKAEHDRLIEIAHTQARRASEL